MKLQATHANCVFADLAAHDISEPFYLLRHDVDLSPDAALVMAELEADLGVRASYFLFVSSPLYNLHSERYCQTPARLVDMGHEVGLHYDITVYNRGLNVGEAYENERRALAALTGQPVKAIALHNPSLADGDPLRAAAGVINAYTAIETHRLTYVSDSCGAWRDDSLKLLEQRELPRRLQLLIHPFFWAKEAGDRWERLEQFVDTRLSETESWARQIRDQWSQHEGVREDEKRRRALAEPQSGPA